MKRIVIVCGFLSSLFPLAALDEPVAAEATQQDAAPLQYNVDLPKVANDKPVAAEPPKKDAAPLQYNVDLPTGNQPQPIYFTKDMTFNIGTTQVGFYGFIKMDLTSETRITGTTADVRPSLTPLSSDIPDTRTQTLLDARASRLGFKVEDTVGGTLMKGAVEVDFFTTDGDAIQSNARHPRLRLAYATAELPSHLFFLTGQYYSLVMPYPEIDMPTRVNTTFYPPGVINARKPQLRLGYKQYFTSNRLLSYEFDAELQGYNNPSAFVTIRGGDPAQGAEQKWPLFNAKLTWLSDSFKWEAVFSGTKSYDIINSAGVRLHTDVWGITSTAAVYWGNLIVWATGHHLVGLTGLCSNYVSQLALINHSTTLKAVKANGGALAMRYDFIKKKLWTDIMCGVERASEIPTSSLFSGTALRKIENFRANLIGAFWKHWQIGLEYERTYVTAYNGITGTNNQVHLGVLYIFGKP